jgi:transcriptional regulator with XRE-family HTH domain
MKLIKELRQDIIMENGRKMSQDALAKAMNVSRSTVAMWETDGSIPDIMTVIKLADFFGVTTDYLLGRDVSVISGEKPNKFIDNIDLSNFEIDIIKKIKLLNNKGRDKLCMYLDDLLENPSNINNDDTVKNEDVS